jgi:hypothetical protein
VMRCSNCEAISQVLIRRTGTTMNNLAITHHALGRHADALAMMERALEFWRRVLLADHPDIGEGCEGRDGLHAVW